MIARLGIFLGLATAATLVGCGSSPQEYGANSDEFNRLFPSCDAHFDAKPLKYVSQMNNKEISKLLKENKLIYPFEKNLYIERSENLDGVEFIFSDPKEYRGSLRGEIYFVPNQPSVSARYLISNDMLCTKSIFGLKQQKIFKIFGGDIIFYDASGKSNNIKIEKIR